MSERSTTVCLLAIIATFATTVGAFAAPKSITNGELKYTIAIPSECRLDEGPGTLEAICSADLDEAKAAEMPKATAFLLEIDAEAVPSDAKPYAEAEFRLEIPEAVCGESDATRVKLANLKIDKADTTTMISADVICPEIKFLALEERHARVRYVIAPKYRYRLMTRAPASEATKTKSAADAFFASFKQTAE
jgi:hypothetical protein